MMSTFSQVAAFIMKTILFVVTLFFVSVLSQCSEFPQYIECSSGPSFFAGINSSSPSGSVIEGCVFVDTSITCAHNGPASEFFYLIVDSTLQAHVIDADIINNWNEDFLQIEGCFLENGGINCTSEPSYFSGVNSNSTSGSNIEGCVLIGDSITCGGGEYFFLTVDNTLQAHIIDADIINNWTEDFVQIDGCFVQNGGINCTSEPSFFAGVNSNSTLGSDIEGCVLIDDSITCGGGEFFSLAVDSTLQAHFIATDIINNWNEDFIQIEGCLLQNGGINCTSEPSYFSGVHSNSTAGSDIEGCLLKNNSIACESSEFVDLTVDSTLKTDVINHFAQDYVEVEGCFVQNGTINCTVGTSNFKHLAVTGHFLLTNSLVTNYNPSPLTYYEQSTSFTFTIQGSFTNPISMTIIASRIGNMAILQWGLIESTCTHSNMIITANAGSIPQRFRPNAAALVYSTLVINSGVTVAGYVQFGSDGSLQIARQGSPPFFSNSGQCGILYSSTFYLTA